MFNVSPSDKYRAGVYTAMAIMYLSESADEPDETKTILTDVSRTFLPKSLRTVINDKRTVIAFICYTMLAYYYLFLEREAL